MTNVDFIKTVLYACNDKINDGYINFNPDVVNEGGVDTLTITMFQPSDETTLTLSFPII